MTKEISQIRVNEIKFSRKKSVLQWQYVLKLQLTTVLTRVIFVLEG